jgi:hypothetical protein
MIGAAVNNIQTGAQKNTLVFNYKNNWFDWEEDEFESDGDFEKYTCAKYDTDVSKVLKRYI